MKTLVNRNGLSDFRVVPFTIELAKITIRLYSSHSGYHSKVHRICCITLNVQIVVSHCLSQLVFEIGKLTPHEDYA